MKKEKIINAPEGCEIEKVEIVDGVAVVKFREKERKERKLPKSWEEFCEMFPLSSEEVSIDSEDCAVYDRYSPSSDRTPRDFQSDILTFPDRATAEAVLALCQLIQMRNAYNGDWVPDWNNAFEMKHCVFFEKKNICSSAVFGCPELLYFKNAELRDEFLRNFRPFIEKLKPLYGIKEEQYINVEERGGKE